MAAKIRLQKISVARVQVAGRRRMAARIRLQILVARTKL